LIDFGLARRIAIALGRSVAVAGGTVDVQASVGVAYTNRADVSSDELVGHADTAMYESKRNGRGRPVTCVPGLSAA
jgi:GGDEF domain-containing protein